MIRRCQTRFRMTTLEAAENPAALCQTAPQAIDHTSAFQHDRCARSQRPGLRSPIDRLRGLFYVISIESGIVRRPS